MHFCVVRRARQQAFQLVRDDGSVALTGTPQADVDECVAAIRELTTCLREGVGVVRQSKPDLHRFTVSGELGTELAESAVCGSAAEVDALIAELQRWAAASKQFRIVFPPEQRVAQAAHGEIGVAVRYDL